MSYPILSARISLPGLKRMVFPGGIATSSPVRGFLPTPLLRGLTIKTPKPLSSILSPRLRAFFSELNTDSTAISAFTFVMLSCSATRFTMSCFITRTLHNLVTGYYLWLYTVSRHFYLERMGKGAEGSRGNRFLNECVAWKSCRGH